MELIVVLIVIYIGGPLGVLFILLGGFGLWRGKNPEARSRAKTFLITGWVVLIAAALAFRTIANVNFGL